MNMYIHKNFLGELFYLCNIKYPCVLKYSNISLWHRIAGLIDEKITSIDKPTVPLLLSDPTVLLLQIILSLPFSITKGL